MKHTSHRGYEWKAAALAAGLAATLAAAGYAFTIPARGILHSFGNTAAGVGMAVGMQILPGLITALTFILLLVGAKYLTRYRDYRSFTHPPAPATVLHAQEAWAQLAADAAGKDSVPAEVRRHIRDANTTLNQYAARGGKVPRRDVTARLKRYLNPATIQRVREQLTDDCPPPGQDTRHGGPMTAMPPRRTQRANPIVGALAAGLIALLPAGPATAQHTQTPSAAAAGISPDTSVQTPAEEAPETMDPDTEPVPPVGWGGADLFVLYTAAAAVLALGAVGSLVWGGGRSKRD